MKDRITLLQVAEETHVPESFMMKDTIGSLCKEDNTVWDLSTLHIYPEGEQQTPGRKKKNQVLLTVRVCQLSEAFN